METKEKCISIECDINKNNGDLLFCPTHRFRWKEYCKAKGIETIIIPKSDEELALDEFRNNLGGKTK